MPYIAFPVELFSEGMERVVARRYFCLSVFWPDSLKTALMEKSEELHLKALVCVYVSFTALYHSCPLFMCTAYLTVRLESR